LTPAERYIRAGSKQQEEGGMYGRGDQTGKGRWTRAGLLRAGLGGGAVIAGGAAIGAQGGGGTSLAAPSKDGDAEILRLFLALERGQEAFYRAALRKGGLDSELRAFVEAAGRQETEHVAFLTKQLGSGAGPRAQTDFGDLLSSPERFRDAAIEFEEATIGAYLGQGANLTREVVATVVTLVSVEARQAAWIRSIAGVSPAPRAADPARKPDEVLADLRSRGFIA
jgi:rubrerythrin